MILGILQARVSSTRLPGKVLLPLVGAPMLVRQIERLQRSTMIDQLLLATSTGPEDDPLEELAKQIGLPVFRGALDDVLDRFYQAAASCNPGHVVRLTGDCPLTDPEIVDNVVRYHLEGEYDYTSNIHPPTFPDGLDVEVVRFEILQAAWKEAATAVEREHVTWFIYQQPERFRLGNLRNPVDHSGLRWTVDEAEDYEFVTRVYEALYPGNPAFNYNDVLALLEEKPALQRLNSHHERNARMRVK